MSLLFGAAYYLEYMPYDRLEKDIEMMKKAGMNVIRIAESTWSTLEKRDGEFDFSYIDQMMDAAYKAGMSIIIGTPTYAVPSWLVKKHPDIMVFDGIERKKYGRRQIMDIMNPDFRFYAERVIRKLIEHTASHPGVIGFQIDNETKHYGTSSELVQKLFVEELKEKFETPEKLNDAFYLNYWSNAIHDWEDFPDMTGCINGGLASEYSKFQRKLAAEYLQWQAGIVSEYKKEEQFITHNFDFEWKKFGADIAQDGYSYGIQPDINHYEASNAVTIAGTDIYHPTQDDLTGAEIAFGGDEIRSLKGEPYLVLECQAQAFKYWTPFPGQLRLQGYSHLASGATSVMYWNWHSIHNGYETYWKGLLSHDLDTNPTYEEACQMGNEWQKIGQEQLVITKKNDIALVVDNHTLDAFKWFPIDRDLSYNDVVRHIYDCLFELNLECDVVDVHALDTSKYKMIVTPALYSASEQTIQKLNEFVKQGGVLVSTFKSFVSDEHLSVYPKKQPYGMTDCFGITYNQFSEPCKAKLHPMCEAMGEKDSDLSYFMELLVPDQAETLAGYTHKYWGKYSSITHNRYGEGDAYYLGCFAQKEVVKNLLRMAAESMASKNKAEQINDAGSTSKYTWPVIVRKGVNQKGQLVHYLLHYSQENEEIENIWGDVVDILTGQTYKQGEQISLSDWDVKILAAK